MSRIRSKDTKPEMIVRRGLHAAGYRFRLHSKELPGKPDLVLPKFGAVIFVHGCFWHGHENCRYFRIPKSRQEFWEGKICGNQQRDKQVIEELLCAGWRVLVVWECATRSIFVENLVGTVACWLHGGGARAELRGNEDHATSGEWQD